MNQDSMDSRLRGNDRKHTARSVFSWPVRVYYEDTDAAGVVFYANYLNFMERARTEWLRALGFEQTALARDHQVVFVVRAVAIEYVLPALFNDLLEVGVELVKARGSVLEMKQAICRGGQALVTAEVKVACLNTRSFKPVRIPQAILAKLSMGQA